MDAPPNNDNGNGKVTLAVLGTKLDNVIHLLERHCEEADKRDERLNALEKHQEGQDQRINNIEGKVNTWNVVNSVGALVAAVLAYLGLKN